LASVTALLVLCNVSAAGAETPNRPSSRLYTGVAVVGGFPKLSIDGGPALSEDSTPNAALNAAYLQGLLPYFGVILSASVGTAGTAWSEDRGESRARAQLALGPVFVFQLPGWTVDWRIGLPVGYTHAWHKPVEGRAVADEYSNGHGMNAALLFGADAIGKHHGGFIDFAYTYRLTWLTHTATLKSDESVHTEQSYRYSEGGFTFGGGYVYKF
jgi:hypothetical protein